jgi:uncharacterized protein YndB with AHSA1/START domain
MSSNSTDRIEREILLEATPARVWRALSNAEEFGRWFGVALQGQVFTPGQHTQGPITHPGYEHILFKALIEALEPERRLALRWHPYAVDPAVDYAGEPTTLVEFTLQPVDGGTLLRVSESGFDRIPPERRDEAYRMNSGGWSAQMLNIEQHVATP